MSKPNSLESLLAAFSKTEKLRDETEALKIRLEGEVNAALASGDVLENETAQALQTKRGQIDLVPGKLAQINARLESLAAEIQTEFDQRRNSFNSARAAAREVAKGKLRTIILPLIQELQGVTGEEIVQNLYPFTKLAAQLDAFDNPISFQITVHQNYVAAARLLLAAEKDLAGLQP